MSHDERFEVLCSGYLGGLLDEQEVAEFQQFLQGSPQYRKRFATYLRTNAVLASQQPRAEAPTHDERCDEQCIALLRGLMTAQESAAFNQQLQKDRGARARLAAVSRIDVLLRDVLQEDASQPAPAAVRAASPNVKRPTTGRARRPAAGRASRPVPPARNGMLIAAALVLVLGIIGGVVVMNQGAPPVPILAEVVAADQTWLDDRPVTAGARLVAAAALDTREAGSVQVRWPDGSEIIMPAHSRVRLGVDGVTVQLERGEVRASVAKQSDGHTFVVATGRSQVRVIGTQFVVRTDSQADHVEVTEGRVEVQAHNDDQVVALKAGDVVRVDQAGVEPQMPTKLIQSVGIFDEATQDIVPGLEHIDSDQRIPYASMPRAFNVIVDCPSVVKSIKFEGEYFWRTPRGERRQIVIDFIDGQLPYAVLGARLKPGDTLDGKFLRAGRIEFTMQLYADKIATQPLGDPIPYVITINPAEE